MCFGVLHRATHPIALLRALAGVLAPGGEIVLETYASRLGADAPVIEVHEPGDVYARDGFVYWGFSPEGLPRLGRIVGLDKVEVVESTSWTSAATRGSSRCYDGRLTARCDQERARLPATNPPMPADESERTLDVWRTYRSR